LPTTTDAAFYLGMLGEGLLASGLQLNRELAMGALVPLAQKLGCDVEKAAKGVIAIASSHMASLIRDLTMEQGIDAREFKLLPFGGAGPMMGTQIARELAVNEILIAPHAGNFSAWGLLGADLLRTRARTKVMALTDGAIQEANAVLSELVPLLMAEEAAGKSTLEETLIVTLDMRFSGQEHTLSVTPRQSKGRILSSASDVEALFHETYRYTYGASLDNRIDLVTIRVARRRALPVRREKYEYERVGKAGTGKYFSFAEDRRVSFTTAQRGDLEVGRRYHGPAIVYEPTTTTYVDVDFSYGVDHNGCLLLQRKG